MGANQFIPIPLPNPTFLPFVDSNLKTITAVTNASPAKITTSTPHGFAPGDVVIVRGVLGMAGAAPGINGLFTVFAIIDALNFTITADTSVAAAYGGGGQVAIAGKRFVQNVTPGTPIEIETGDGFGNAIDHKLAPGDAVRISGVIGIPNANGVWIVTPTSTTTFTLDGSSGFGVYTPGTGIVDEGPFPVVIDTTPIPHGYGTGAIVDVRANSSDSGRLFEITVIDATHFSLDLEGEDIQYPLGGIVREVVAEAVDLASIAPPSGVEKRKTFSLAGDYSGRIIIEGSMDNDLYSPFLLFNEGRPGSIKVVEVNVPFIRARSENLVINSGSLVAFMAAEQNCDCDTSGPDHGSNFYDTLDVPDPTELELDREDPIGILTATDGTPVVRILTAAPHPYVTGDMVKISDVVDGSGFPLASVNGVWTITVIDDLNFTLDTSIFMSSGTGGSVEIITAPNTSPIPLTTAVPHGYFTGDTVRVTGVVDDETPRIILTAFSPDGVTLVTITTTGAHGYTTGNRVNITGNTLLPDGEYTITVTGLTTFTLDGVFGPISSGGGVSLRIPGADGDFVITVTGPTTFTLDGSVATGPGTGGTVQALASAATPTNTLKSEKTLQLQGGPYTGTFVIDGTLDPGLDPVFLPFDQFNTGGADEKLELDALFFSMRVRPVGAEGDVAIWIGSQLTCDCLPPPPLLGDPSKPTVRSGVVPPSKSKTERAAAKASRKRK